MNGHLSWILKKGVKVLFDYEVPFYSDRLGLRDPGGTMTLGVPTLRLPIYTLKL